MSTEPTTQHQAEQHAAENAHDAGQQAELDVTQTDEEAASTTDAGYTADSVSTDSVSTDSASIDSGNTDESGRADAEEQDHLEQSVTAETALHQLESERAGSDSDEEGQSDESGALTSASSSSPSSSSGRSGRRGDLEHEGEVAADFLEQLLDIADLDGDLEVNVEGDRAAVAIVDSEEGPAPTRLVGRDGSVLEALQELTRLAVQAETGDRSRLMLDVAGHRAGRRLELVELARRTAETVKKSGERAELEPMSAFERKVVHDEILAAGLVSESEGAEPHRYVVVLPGT